MIKDIGTNIRMKEEGSKLCPNSGAQIGKIMESVKEECSKGGDDLVVIQGGGNNLVGLGHKETADQVVKTVTEIMNGKRNRKVAVLSIIRRPREMISEKYEDERKKANRDIQTELCKMKENKMQVSFIDLDPVIHKSMFRVDGVHLNEEGNDRMCMRILTWMKQKEANVNERNRK